MSKLKRLLIDKVASNKKGKIVYISVMAFFWAVVVTFAILLLLALFSPLSYFTNRKAVDRVESYIHKNAGTLSGKFTLNNVYSDDSYTYGIEAFCSNGSGQELLRVSVMLRSNWDAKTSSVTYSFFYDGLFDKYKIIYTDNVVSYGSNFSVGFYREPDRSVSLSEHYDPTWLQEITAKAAIKNADRVMNIVLAKMDVTLEDVENEILAFTDKAVAIFIASIVLTSVFFVLGLAALIIYLVVVRPNKKSMPAGATADEGAATEQPEIKDPNTEPAAAMAETTPTASENVENINFDELSEPAEPLQNLEQPTGSNVYTEPAEPVQNLEQPTGSNIHTEPAEPVHTQNAEPRATAGTRGTPAAKTLSLYSLFYTVFGAIMALGLLLYYIPQFANNEYHPDTVNYIHQNGLFGVLGFSLIMPVFIALSVLSAVCAYAPIKEEKKHRIVLYVNTIALITTLFFFVYYTLTRVLILQNEWASQIEEWFVLLYYALLVVAELAYFCIAKGAAPKCLSVGIAFFALFALFIPLSFNSELFFGSENGINMLASQSIFITDEYIGGKVALGILCWIHFLVALAALVINTVLLLRDGSKSGLCTAMNAACLMAALLYFIEGVVFSIINTSTRPNFTFYTMSFIPPVVIAPAFMLFYHLKSSQTPAKDTDANINGYVPMVMHVLLLFFGIAVWTYIWIHRVTRFLNKWAKDNRRDPAAQTLLCLFVPFYFVYWCYRSAKLVENKLAENGVSSSLAVPCVITALFMWIIPPIILQLKINELCGGAPAAKIPAPEQPVKASAAPKDENVAIESIKQYKELLDSGIITQEEFESKKKQLLGL